ncbi:MAG: hypothetical protein ACNS62_01385 [Candidatus Cyclobacteriaceae bacterium M3_2C_046]
MLVNKQQQGIVVFHIWRSLAYNHRVLISLILIFSGFGWQSISVSLWPGLILVFMGNLFLLVKGYNNMVDPGTFEAAAKWEKTDPGRMEELIKINQKIKKWDVSAFDITNPAGAFTFIGLIIILVILLILAANSNPALGIIAADMAVLALPHWVTGARKILTTPKLINKIKIYKKLLPVFTDYLNDYEVEYLMLLRGQETKLPGDVKLKINLKDPPKGFLGIYCQLNMNTVNGTDYPYLYMVLVAKESYGLKNVFNQIQLPAQIIKEFNQEGEIDIIVMRQRTTKTSGYHTNARKMAQIFDSGLTVAEQYIRKKDKQ